MDQTAVARREKRSTQKRSVKSTVLSPLPLPVKTSGALWWKMCVAVKVMMGRQGGIEAGSGRSMAGSAMSEVMICVERQ
jgi:hypothetical protein